MQALDAFYYTPPSTGVIDVILFVHGIRSGHETFSTLVSKLTKLFDTTHPTMTTTPNRRVEFTYFDYKYRQSIAENGRKLADQLIGQFKGKKDVHVTIVGHSMGGLVGRLALLQMGDQLPFVKRLIMLATPNHGTLTTGTMGILAQLTRELTGKVWTLVSRKTGVKELTEIDKLLKIHLKQQTFKNTLHVDYITIPATCFHEGAGIAALLSDARSGKIAAVPLALQLAPVAMKVVSSLAGLGPIASAILTAHPAWRVGLQIPHDGIVEESSVFLGTRDKVTRRSERRQTCMGVSACGPYAHVRHDDFMEESHVTIQAAQTTADIISDVLNSPDLTAWRIGKEKIIDYVFEP